MTEKTKRDNQKLFTFLLTVLVISSILVLSTPVSGEMISAQSATNSGSNDISFDNNKQTIGQGNTTTYDVIIKNAPGGISNYSYKVRTGSKRTATLTGFTFAGSPDKTSTTFGSSNGSLIVTATNSSIPAGTNLTIGTVTVKGLTPGSTSLDLQINHLTNSTNGTIVAGVQNGSVTVTGNRLQFKKNQQVVSEGGTTTYDVVLKDAPNGVSVYSYDIIVGDANTAKITGFSFDGNPNRNIQIWGSNNQSIEVTATGSNIPSGTNIKIGTVTVAGSTNGSTSLGLNINQLFDLNNNKITPSTSNGSIMVKSKEIKFKNPHQTVAVNSSTTLEVILTGAPNGVSMYSYSVSVNDTNTVRIENFTFAGSPTRKSILFSTSNSSVMVSGRMSDISAGTNVTIGTVKISGVNQGVTPIQIQNSQIIDLNSSFVDHQVASKNSINVTNSSRTSAPGDLNGNGMAATDPDNDGIYEDINGDGSADLRDLQLFFNLVQPSATLPNNPAFFDINQDGSVDLRDLQPFFNEVRP
jgi:hypothetical protein